MRKNHHIIIVPGLSDQIPPSIIRWWQEPHITVRTWPFGWRTEGTFEEKLNALLEHIDNTAVLNATISLIGTSAGGSAAINALVQRPAIVHRVVNIGGRLRSGSTGVQPTLHQAAQGAPAFRESVLACEQAEPQFDQPMRARIMTLTPLRDRAVPRETVALPGADNRRLTCVGHAASIGVGLTLYRPLLLKFLTQ